MCVVCIEGHNFIFFHELIFSQSFGRLGMTYPSVLTITCDRFPVCFNDKQINLSCGLLYWFISWINFCIRLVGWYDQLPFVLHRLLVSLTHFSSAILYRNVDWYDALDFSYDMSIPNVAHLDPQPGGCCTVLPFFIGKILELPVTATQDYSLFNILHDYSIRLWKEQISLIQEDCGLISFIVHPDYIISACARRIYVELLAYLSNLRSKGEVWMALPRDVAAWWRLRHEMNLVNVGGSWCIEGRGSERARVAYAVLQNDKITYQIDPVSQ